MGEILEKKVCDLWKSTSPNTKRAILGISVLLFLIILIALIGVASTGSSCDKVDSEPTDDPKCGNPTQKKVDLENDVILNQISNKRDVSAKWISDTKLKYQDADGNIKIFNSGDEKSTEFISFQTLNGYKKL